MRAINEREIPAKSARFPPSSLVFSFPQAHRQMRSQTDKVPDARHQNRQPFLFLLNFPFLYPQAHHSRVGEVYEDDGAQTFFFPPSPCSRPRWPPTYDAGADR